MSQAVQILEVREWHRQLADYLLTHPKPTLREMSAHFGRTKPWLSSIIHTDAFRAYMHKRRAEVDAAITEGVVVSLRERAETISHLAFDAIEERLSDQDLLLTTPLKDITKVAETTLNFIFGDEKRASGGGSNGTTINNNLVISGDDLSFVLEARKKRQQFQLIEGGHDNNQHESELDSGSNDETPDRLSSGWEDSDG